MCVSRGALITRLNHLTKCHDQAGISGQVNDLLRSISFGRVFSEKAAQNWTKTSDQNEGEDSYTAQ